MKKSVIIFDFDGTLVESFRPGLECCLDTAKKHGWPITEGTTENIKRLWGSPTMIIMNACWPDKDPQVLRDAFNRLNIIMTVPLFPGVKETLERIRRNGADMYIYTGRHRQGTRRLLNLVGIAKFFSRILTCDDVKNGKPHPDGLNRIMEPLEKVGRARDDCLFVGDGFISDRDCAEAAGIEFVAVAEAENISREHFREHGIPDSNIIDSVRDLPAWLGIR